MHIYTWYIFKILFNSRLLTLNILLEIIVCKNIYVYICVCVRARSYARMQSHIFMYTFITLHIYFKGWCVAFRLSPTPSLSIYLSISLCACTHIYNYVYISIYILWKIFSGFNVCENVFVTTRRSILSNSLCIYICFWINMCVNVSARVVSHFLMLVPPFFE